MISDYSISFVIPTRNRTSFIEPLIRRCLEINGSQIIISDNSDVKTLDKLLVKYNTKRIKYYYYPEKISVIENFNNALKYVETTYVCYLGDDDMVGPGIEESLTIMNENNIDVLNVDYVTKPLQYFWPNNPTKRWGDIGSKLYFSSYYGSFKINNIFKAKRLVKINFGLGPLLLPRLYLGIVRTSLLHKILDKNRNVFGGYSPDIFSSYILSIECSNPYIIDYPIIIPGACSKSTSAARANRTDIGELLDNDHLGRFKNVQWDKRIPEFYSPYNVWAATLLIGIEENNDKISLFSFSHLYALNIINSNFNLLKVINAINSLSRNNTPRKILIFVFIFVNILKILILKAIHYLKFLVHKRPGGAKYEVDNITDTYNAFVSIKNHLNKSNVKILIK
jgi:hypothetical protein